MTEAGIAPVDDTVDEIELDTDAALGGDAELQSAPDTDTDEPDEMPESVPSPDEGPEAVAEPDIPVEPFAFNAFKQRNELPGLTWDAKSKSIRVDDDRGLERMKQLLSHGREWEARGRQQLVATQKELHAAKAQPHAEIEQAKVYMAEFEQMMQMEPEQLWAFINEARTNYPLMQAKAERAYAERLMEQARTANQPPEPDVEMVVGQAQEAAAGLVQELLHDQPWATPQLVAKVTTYFSDVRQLDQFVKRATRDMPELGLRAGQYAIDYDAARQLLGEYLEPYRDAHGQRTAAARDLQTTQSAAQRNAASLSRAKPPAAPAPAKSPAANPNRQRPQDVVREAMKVWGEMNR